MKPFKFLLGLITMCIFALCIPQSTLAMTTWDGGPDITIADTPTTTTVSLEIPDVFEVMNRDSIPVVDPYPYRLSIYGIAPSIPWRPEEYYYYCFTSWNELCDFLDELTEENIHPSIYYSFRWFIWNSGNSCLQNGVWHRGDGDINPNPPAVVLPPEYVE